MKPAVVVAGLSIVANVVLLGFVLIPGTGETQREAPKLESAVGGTSAGVAQETGLHRAIEAGDIAALTQAGAPPELIRSIEIGRAYMQYQEKMRRLARGLNDNLPPFWKDPQGGNPFAGPMRERHMQIFAAERQFQDELAKLTGVDVSLMTDARMASLSFLPKETLSKLRQIERDYGELTGEAYAESAGIVTSEDREKLKLVNEEKDREIEALLGPAGFQEYLLRTSPSAMVLRNQYGSVIENEEQFRALFALQKAYDDKYGAGFGQGPQDQAAMQARNEARSELQRDIESVLGSDLMKLAQRKNEGEYRTLSALTGRYDLPEGTPDTVYDMRDRYGAQSQQIGSDSRLSAEDRAAKLRSLAAAAQAEVEQLLGSKAAAAYAERSSWIRQLSSGRVSASGQGAPQGVVRFGVPAVSLPLAPGG